ncbi:hypothetical protein G6F50_016958 [Rhizopus delemar]|uniref:Uncharacterized protein n=1 Tax=Rhizopus delemar TaxID=936053 RepID=A0A9P6XRD7_9FUNG|nr:hypothetical protein G6F50_016958 [Rhizopus delemar]
MGDTTERVARADAGHAIAAQHGIDAARQRAQVHRHVGSLGHQAAGGVEQRDGAVFALLDIAGERRTDQRVAHFFGDGQQAVAEDLHFDGVEGVGFGGGGQCGGHVGLP